MKKVLFILLILLSGCAGTYYVSPTHYDACHLDCHKREHAYYYKHWPFRSTHVYVKPININNRPNKPNKPNRPNNKPIKNKKR